MDRFFLGLLTGTAALVVPLIVASLSLPGPGRVFQPGPSSQQTVANSEAVSNQPTQANLPARPQVQESSARPKDPRRHYVEDAGFSVLLPDGWKILTTAELNAYDKMNLLGDGLGESLLFAASDSPDEDAASGMTLYLDAGRASREMLGFMKVMESVVPTQMPGTRLKSGARAVTIAGFKGATATFEMAANTVANAQTFDFKYTAVDVAGQALIITEMIKPNTNAADALAAIANSIVVEK